MTMTELTGFRATEREQQRAADLMRLTPRSGATALDVGARDGHFSRLLAERFERVVALDLQQPAFRIDRVECVAGDATALQYPDRSFDFVFCAEVLEHIPSHRLRAACQELQRVCRGRLLIGVPDRQDLRIGRTTCASCGKHNPPWGHVNRFDEASLAELFPVCRPLEVSRVGLVDDNTNDLACWLLDRAGNPYGTYQQDEACVHCGGPLGQPSPRSLLRKGMTKLGYWVQGLAARQPRGNWIHVLFERQ